MYIYEIREPPPKQTAVAIRAFHIQLDPERERLVKLGTMILDEWDFVNLKALDFGWAMKIPIDTEGDQKQLKAELRKAAAKRPMPKIQVIPERFSLSELKRTVSALKTIGLECMTDRESTLEERFEKEEDAVECPKALTF
jgi:hypothetical protein